MKDFQRPDDADGPADDPREMYGQPQHERPSTPAAAVQEAYGPAQHDDDGDLASDAQLAAWRVEDRSDGWAREAAGVRTRTTFAGQPSAGSREVHG